MDAKSGKKDLSRQLGLVTIFCIATGAMISSGIFILPGLAHAIAGPAVVLSYLIAGILALMGILSIAELTTAMPKAGGDYFYISRGMGPAVGTTAGLLSWFALSMKSSFALVGLGFLLQPLTGVNWHIIAALGCVVFVCLNIVGVKEAARFQVVLVIALLLLMVIFVVRGMTVVKVEYFSPFAPAGLRGTLSAVGFVFVSYGGLLQVASVAGETKRPGLVIPVSMIAAVCIITVIYTLMVFVASGSLGSQQLDNSMTPISDTAFISMGRAGQIAMGVAAFLAFVTTANAGVMSASRYIYAVSEDDLFPAAFSKLSKRFHSPYRAILLTGGLIFVSVFVNLKILIETASIVFIIGYVLAALAVIILRESKLQSYRPSFNAPFYPWIQIICIIVFVLVIVEMGTEAYLITAGFIFVGFAFYWFYGKEKADIESALIHLVSRITSKELVNSSLDGELRDIVRERDGIVTDQFDKMIEKSIILDLDRHMTLEEFTKIAAEKLAERLDLDSSKLMDMLLAREKDSSTVLNPTLAIPHVVIDGENRFYILIARSQQGVAFSEHAPNVHAVFILLGTRDLRNLHLRALSAIAQITIEKQFEKRWLTAKDSENIRNLILLSIRKRDSST